MAKVQEKHIEQLNDAYNENQRQASERCALYEKKIQEFSSQLHALNEEKLLLLKEHEIMKAKLRTYEIDSTLNRGTGAGGSANFYGKLALSQKHTVKLREQFSPDWLFDWKGGNFRMEDEEGEIFDNTYLEDLKGGFGRESLTLDEIQRRNSMVPPHLRSSYMPQYTNDEPKVDH